MTSSRIGRGAIVTLGAAASMAWAAGAANACENTPRQPVPPKTLDHNPTPHGTDHRTKTKPNTACAVSDDDVQYAAVGQDGKPLGAWQNAVSGHYQGTSQEPIHGYQVRLNPDVVTNACVGNVDISLASYDTYGDSWDSSGGPDHLPQKFVDYSHVQLSTKSSTDASQTITVKLPGTPGSKSCFGQIDLYFGTKIYDGGNGPGHGPVPDRDHGVTTPNPQTELITAWNGADEGGCAAVPPVVPSTPTTTPSTPAKTTPPTTSPTTHPSTPTSSTPAAPAPKPSTSTPTTPPTTATPGTPTLAHTGANVGEVSLVALAFFGAGGTAMFASRKAKAVGARKH